ncbi:MAG: hypothetical protein VKJ44_05860 [Synechococcus sp.]|nr:hypothetical protein [Synechococcus sp.]
MEGSAPIPASISFRQLQSYALRARTDRQPDTAAAVDPAAQALEAALESWNRSSQELLRLLQQAGPTLGQGRNPKQLMALGALQAHVSLGLQALASSRRSQG